MRSPFSILITRQCITSSTKILISYFVAMGLLTKSLKAIFLPCPSSTLSPCKIPWGNPT